MANDILKNFSSNYQQVLQRAIQLCQKTDAPTITPEALFYSLILQTDSLGAKILNKLNAKDKNFQHWFITQITEPQNLPEFTEPAKQIINHSVNIAFTHQHSYIATEHLLLALLEDQSPLLQQLYQKLQLNIPNLKKQLNLILNSTSKFQNFASSFKGFSADDDLLELSGNPTKTAVLDTFTLDLTKAASQKNIDPVIGRDPEINRLIEILMRRHKNNPLILGDPGVGKTALVEGLAKRISLGEVPDILLNKKILSLDIALLVAGTMFRGEFENRLKNLLAEIKKDANIIIFIDEIHTIIGAGSTQGSMDIANILKPALARGEIRCIGATTYEEYKKQLEHDAALTRRFQQIKINEPSKEETIKIISGVKTNYEDYHQVNITDEAIRVAVELSLQYISDRFLPDKALDLIDEAAAKAKIKRKTDPQQTKLKELHNKLAEIKALKEAEIIKENFKEAIFLKAQEKEITEQIIILNNKIKTTPGQLAAIGAEDICQVVSQITNIPLKELLLEERTKFLNLEKVLAKKIIGQPKALANLAASIRKVKAGLGQQNKPLGSFILLGPSGSGKTFTAKILSQLLFNNPQALVRIDMSEFSEKFNISKLIGAPAGYVGYKENSKLTDAVKRNPNSLVLFDEIEKAHPDVFNLLLQILDEGYLTDAIGKKIDFRNTFIILTSNLGTEKINKALGFDNNAEQDELALLAEIKKFFRPEFINRLDKIIIYNKLADNDLHKIIKIELQNLQDRLASQAITLQIQPEVIPYLLQTNYQPDQGARFIQQNIEELITNPLAEIILQNPLSKFFSLNLKNSNLNIEHGSN